ncbi:MAG: hypothetical protein RLZZ628_2008 [Bacteroidota bacterium]|jgi:hypothetical protein
MQKSNFFKIVACSLLFLNTVFCSVLKGQDLGTMHKAVDTWARLQLSLATSKTQKREFSSATVVYDKATKRYYYGANKGIALSRAVTHPTLLSRYPATALCKNVIGNCSENHAVNQALQDGASWNNLQMYTVYVLFTEPTIAFQATCENCVFTFRGIEILR